MSTTATVNNVKQVSYRFYKGKKSGDGSASQWSLTTKPSRKNAKVLETLFFLEVAPQNPVSSNEDDPYTFDWRKKESPDSKSLLVKLEEADVGELLCVLNGIVKAAGRDGKGLYHDAEKSNTIIGFSAAEKDGRIFGFNLRLSKKDKESGNQSSVNHFISLPEAEILRVLLNEAVLRLTGWHS